MGNRLTNTTVAQGEVFASNLTNQLCDFLSQLQQR